MHSCWHPIIAAFWHPAAWTGFSVLEATTVHVPVGSAWQRGSYRAGLQLGRPPSSRHPWTWCTLVFSAPTWVCFWAANAWAVDSLAGSMKQDTHDSWIIPDKSAVILPTLQFLCRSTTTRGPWQLSALHEKAAWVRQNLLFGDGLCRGLSGRGLSHFYPVTILSFWKQWNWKAFLVCTVLIWVESHACSCTASIPLNLKSGIWRNWPGKEDMYLILLESDKESTRVLLRFFCLSGF